MIKYIVNNAFKIGVIKTLGTICNLLFIVSVTQNLPLEDASTFFVMLSVISVYAIFNKFGLDQALLKYYADSLYDKTDSRNLVIRILVLFSMINILLYAIYYYCKETLYLSLLNRPELLGFCNELFILGFVVSLLLIYSEYMRANSNFVLSSISNTPLTAFCCLIILQLYLYVFIEDISTTLLIDVLLYSNLISLSLVLLIGFFNGAKPKASKNIDKVTFLELLSFSTPLFCNHILLFMLVQADIWIMSKYYGDDVVSLYGASARLLVFLSFFISIITGVLPPLISKLKKQGDMANLESLVRKITTLISLPCICMLLSIVFFSDSILIFFGKEYVEAAPFLIILSFSQIINVLVGPCGYILINFGFGKKIMISALIWAFTAISLSIISAINKFDPTCIAMIFSFCIAANQIHMWSLCVKLCRINSFFSYEALIGFMRLTKNNSKIF